MAKKILFTLLSILMAGLSFGKTIDSLKLADMEIPAGYTKSDNPLCVTPHAISFYNQTALYESFLGKVVKREFQSFNKKGDSGAILYFEFDRAFEGQAFLEGLLWGQSTKPTKLEPDDYYTKGNVLIIWSFKLKSELKEISKAKVAKVLH